jgi:hypothetical protein
MAKQERKRLCSIRADVNVELQTVRFWAYDYSTEAPVPGMDFRFEAKKLHVDLQLPAMLKGCEDSIRDAGALGAGESVAAKFAAMKARAEYLESGADSWTQRTRGEGEGTLLFKALMRYAPEKDEAKVLAFVRSLARSKRDAMLASEHLRDIVAELRAESGKGVEVSELFGELEGM